MWVADDKFCERAALKNMFLYIGDKTKDGRLSYIVIYDEDDLIANQKLNMFFKQDLSNSCCGNVDITGGDPHFPKTLNYEINMLNGQFKLFDKKSNKLYALLYKDNSLQNGINSNLLNA
jgi:hypothetical protein